MIAAVSTIQHCIHCSQYSATPSARPQGYSDIEASRLAIARKWVSRGWVHRQCTGCGSKHAVLHTKTTVVEVTFSGSCDPRPVHVNTQMHTHAHTHAHTHTHRHTHTNTHTHAHTHTCTHKHSHLHTPALTH
jgi:hypothetical protein